MALNLDKALLRKVLSLVLRYQLADEEAKKSLEEELYFLLIDLILSVLPGEE